MKTKKKKDFHRLNLSLGQVSMEKLDKLCKAKEDASYAEIFRRALSLYELYVKIETEGGSLILEDEKGIQRKLLFV